MKYNTTIITIIVPTKNFLISLLILFIAGIIKNTTNKEVWQWLNEQNMIFRWFVLIIFLLLIIIFGKYGPGVDASEFIYQQF